MTPLPSGPGPAATPDPCAIVELRRYVLHPGARERLIAVFDREFVETQEAAGMRVIGQFRDPDAPDNFVWLRGFSSMEARKAALATFYGGPVWAAHSAEANATMIAYDNVFLLRPAREIAGFKLEGLRRPEPGDTASGSADYVLTIHHLKRPAEEGFLDMYESKLLPHLSALGATMTAILVTDTSENTFPRLPVREGEKVLVSLLRLGSGANPAPLRARILEAAGVPAIAGELARVPEVSLLSPTARSLLR